MPALKKGQPVTPIDPAEPDAALEADAADPGEVAEAKARERQTQAGKYGAAKAPPYKPPEDRPRDGEDKKTAWIEIELVGEDDKPIPGEKYEITLPDGSVASGTLDADGLARVEGFEPGQCKVSFPDLDQDAWEPA